VVIMAMWSTAIEATPTATLLVAAVTMEET
jgi:hypothetical protein